MKKIICGILLLCFSSALAQSFSLKSGEGTFYDSIAGTDSGNCSIFIPANDFMYCALNTIDYNNSNACGGYIEVFGPKGSVVLQVVDRCPECKEGDVDMTEQAFAIIDEPINGRIPITWKFIESPKEENIAIKFKEGSSKYHVEVQLSQIRYPITTLEYLDNGTWVTMERRLYNFFVEPKGIESPMDLRVTSVTGDQLIFEDINLVIGSQDTVKQFTQVDDATLSIANTVYRDVQNSTVLYPNPFNDKLNLEGKENVNWRLYDTQGKLLFSGNHFPIENRLKELPVGMYYLILVDSKKVIKVSKSSF